MSSAFSFVLFSRTERKAINHILIYKESIYIRSLTQNHSSEGGSTTKLFAHAKDLSPVVVRYEKGIGEEKVSERLFSDEKERSKNKTHHAPIIQNAVKTPTPPHWTNCLTLATVGTTSTFDAAQCCLGMKDLSTSLMCVKCFVSFYSAALLLRKRKTFSSKFRVLCFCTKTLNSFKAVLRFRISTRCSSKKRASSVANTHARARTTGRSKKRIRSSGGVKRITQK